MRPLRTSDEDARWEYRDAALALAAAVAANPDDPDAFRPMLERYRDAVWVWRQTTPLTHRYPDSQT